jgi:hypothetical protein
VAARGPGEGFEDLYEDDGVLVAGFTNLVLTF